MAHLSLSASDLAVPVPIRDPRLFNYLNSPVFERMAVSPGLPQGERAFGLLPRELPATVSNTWRYTALSFVVFLVFALIGFVGITATQNFQSLWGAAGVPRTYIRN